MTPECRSELDQLALAAATAGHAPAIVWGVVDHGALVESGAVGTLHDGTPPDARTVYRIASMTKSFTAAVVLALRDEGVWSLDDPVAAHAPELSAVVGPPGSPAITIRHLLSMTAGLATDDAWADRHLDIGEAEIDAIYAAGPTFTHRANDAFEYSNLGYGMLGRAVRRATGIAVQRHVTERLLEPLGMRDTTWVRPGHDRWARPHRLQDGVAVPDPAEPLGDGEIAPMGGLWTTLADLATWVGWLDAANGPGYGTANDDLLAAASRREMQRIQTYIGMATVAGRSCPAGYGFGLNLRDDPTLGKIVAHSGGLPGYGSNMRWLAGRGIGALAFGNLTYTPMWELTMQMLDVLHRHGAVPDAPALESPLLTRTAERLVALLGAWDDDDASALFADNVALDESFERRRAAAAALVATHGPLRIRQLHVESATAAWIEFDVAGEPLAIEFDVAPLPGAPLQYYGVKD